jgi:hypothetical protein
MTKPAFQCPDRFELFVGLEEGDSELAEHLGECPRCRELAEAERALSAPLSRLRDPIAPAEVLEGALARIGQLEESSRRAGAQLWGAFAAALAFAGGLCAFLWRPLVLDPALDAARSVAQLRVASAAVARAFGPAVERFSTPLLALEGMALLGFAFALHRMLTAQREPAFPFGETRREES